MELDHRDANILTRVLFINRDKRACYLYNETIFIESNKFGQIVDKFIKDSQLDFKKESLESSKKVWTHLINNWGFEHNLSSGNLLKDDFPENFAKPEHTEQEIKEQQEWISMSNPKGATFSRTYDKSSKWRDAYAVVVSEQEEQRLVEVERRRTEQEQECERQRKANSLWHRTLNWFMKKRNKTI